MAQVYSFAQFNDGTKVYFGEPKFGESTRDDTGYQWAELFDDEFLENKVGTIGFAVSGTVGSLWNFGEENDARGKLHDVMKFALPFLQLPLSFEEYSQIGNGYFPVIELHSDGDIVYYKEGLRIFIPSGQNINDFFKQTIFKGKINADAVRKLVLVYGYLDALKNGFGDMRFMSLELTKYLWMMNSERVSRAFSSLRDDGYITPTAGNTSSGFPSFTRINPTGVAAVESFFTDSENEEPIAIEIPTKLEDPYITTEAQDGLLSAAKSAGFDTAKLKNILDELNDSFSRDKPQSAHALIRTLLNHIAPLFGQKTFAQVASNHSWTRTDKDRVHEIQTLFRYDVDESLHAPISKRDTSVKMMSVGLIRTTINNVLQEAIDSLNSTLK
jgi:hypothetical protein